MASAAPASPAPLLDAQASLPRPGPPPLASWQAQAAPGAQQTKYRDKFQSLRQQYETLELMQRERRRELERALDKERRMQEEINMLLDAAAQSMPEFGAPPAPPSPPQHAGQYYARERYYDAPPDAYYDHRAPPPPAGYAREVRRPEAEPRYAYPADARGAPYDGRAPAYDERERERRPAHDEWRAHYNAGYPAPPPHDEPRRVVYDERRAPGPVSPADERRAYEERERPTPPTHYPSPREQFVSPTLARAPQQQQQQAYEFAPIREQRHGPPPREGYTNGPAREAGPQDGPPREVEWVHMNGRRGSVPENGYRNGRGEDK